MARGNYGNLPDFYLEGCLANKRLSMRRIHEVLRLHFEHGRTKRAIARITNVSPTTVSDYLARAKLAGLASPLPPECDNASVEKVLFPPVEPSSVLRPAPAWATVHNEPRRKGVTLELLCQEYKPEQPDGYRPSHRRQRELVRSAPRGQRDVAL